MVSMFTYDLGKKSSWETRITIIRGYIITDAIMSPDGRYLYTANYRSNSVAMVDLTSGDVVRIIRL